MSSATWRLSTTGGIPYKFLGMNGDITDNEGSITWSALIASTDLIAFLVELLPPPLELGNASIPRGAPMPGLPGFIANRVRFKSQDTKRPIDPFTADSAAPAGTYHGNIQVDVIFGPLRS